MNPDRAIRNLSIAIVCLGISQFMIVVAVLLHIWK
jgi:hypothetical protein